MCMTLKPNSNRAWLTLSVQCPQEWHCDPPQTGGHSNYNYIATVFSNISHLAEIREVFLDRDKCVLPHLQPYTQSGSLTRRRGIAGLLRNLCFQVGKLNTYTKVNSTLMASVSLIHNPAQSFTSAGTPHHHFCSWGSVFSILSVFHAADSHWGRRLTSCLSPPPTGRARGVLRGGDRAPPCRPPVPP